MGIAESIGLFASWCKIVAFSQKVLFATIVFTVHLVFSKTWGNFWAAKEDISKLSEGSQEANGPISNKISGLK